MKKSLLSVIAGALFLVAPCFAALTNSDIIKMTKKGIPEDTIILSISQGDNKFETDAQSIISLSEKGVSMNVINAMISSKAGGATSATSSKSASSNAISPESVLMIDEGETMELTYQIPQNRTKARALGFGGVVTYAVLKGKHAKTKTKNTQPSFIVSIPHNAAPETYVSLASLEPRKNNSREVVIGGGYMSYSTGIIPDRLREVTIEKEANQSKAQENFVLYKITPKEPLLPGEFVVALATAQSATFGYFGGGTNNGWFDFAVE